MGPVHSLVWNLGKISHALLHAFSVTQVWIEMYERTGPEYVISRTI